MKQIEKYKGLLDMINGGGANAEGDKFQGGGLLSVLANALATPRGSEDRAKKEALAGLLGNTRPNMRPNRPAPADPAQGMSLNAGPAMQRMPTDPRLALPGNTSGPIDDGLGPMPQRLPSDPSLGFNPANAAPVQPDVNSFSPNPFAGSPGVGVDGRSLDGEILRDAPTGLPPIPPQDATPQPNQEQIAQKFGEDMVNAYGREKANAIMSSPSGQGVYLHYINNGYQLPAL